MRIAELTAFLVHIPLRKPIKHASHERTSTDNLVVRCVLGDGSEGYGEGVPREYVTGETAESALGHLLASDLPGQLPPCGSFGDAVAVAERLRLADVPGDDRRCRGNAARCAVELAVLTAYARHFGRPLSDVVRELAPQLYAPRDVRYSGAITSAQGLKLRLSLWKYKVFGFAQMKVKVGIAGQDDPARLRTVRRILGPGVDLRVDANEAWAPGEAAARINELAPCGITAVEQPVAHEHVAALAEVRRQVGVPVMLDESLCGMVDAVRAREGALCDLFNIRLSKCGGFIPSLRLAQFACAHGLGYQLGCQVGETAVLSAAGRHFGACVGGIRYLEGSYDRYLVKEALGKEDVTFGWGGRAGPFRTPGLGVEIDPAALARVTVREEPLLG